MTHTYILLLTFIQGIAEFLPISSSAHLALLPRLANAADQGIFIDVAAHIGSLLAVLIFYRQKIAELLMFKDKPLLIKLVISFLPVLALGLFVPEIRSIKVIAVASIVFGLLLWLADSLGKNGAAITPFTAFFAGLAQVIALIPGVSRSGITLTAMRARGVSRKDAVQFAFLMSIPAIAAAGGYELLKAVQSSEPIFWAQTAEVIALSALFSLGAIKFMTAFVSRFSLKFFAIYRLVLGALLLIYCK